MCARNVCMPRFNLCVGQSDNHSFVFLVLSNEEANYEFSKNYYNARKFFLLLHPVVSISNDNIQNIFVSTNY